MYEYFFMSMYRILIKQGNYRLKLFIKQGNFRVQLLKNQGNYK